MLLHPQQYVPAPAGAPLPPSPVPCSPELAEQVGGGGRVPWPGWCAQLRTPDPSVPLGSSSFLGLPICAVGMINHPVCAPFLVQLSVLKAVGEGAGGWGGGWPGRFSKGHRID